MNKARPDFKKLLHGFLLVFLGTVILAFGCAVFVIPFDLVPGGVTGLSIALTALLGDALPIDIIIGILSWGLFFLGLIVLGRSFALKTLLSTVVYPPAVSLFLRLVSSEVLSGFFNLGAADDVGVALIVSSLFGGVCIGLGCALSFIGGGSTGGLDVLALIICKYFKRTSSAVVIFVLDAAVILLGMLVLGELTLTLLGIITATVGSVVVDRIFVGRSKSFMAHIVSSRHEEIRDAVISHLGRTATLLHAEGGYSRISSRVLLVTFTMTEYARLLALIKAIDEGAFVVIGKVERVSGRGFDG